MADVDHEMNAIRFVVVSFCPFWTEKKNTILND